jgi:hypothetical protein
MTDKQREAIGLVLEQVERGHIDTARALTIIDSIVGEQSQVTYVPYQPVEVRPAYPWNDKILYQVPNGLFRVTCKQDDPTVRHTDCPNGIGATTLENVKAYYTN